MIKQKEPYFTTRDLMMAAALAALGGVASTYINLIGDFFQSILGFAGTTQWAAGLHVLWIMLAAAFIQKPGTATLTGILKGFVELFSGNTHGLLVLIIDIAAGIIVDAVLLLSKKKQPGLLFYLAAGLASACNVIVFQFFAAVPEDVLTFLAILAASGLAFLSGVIFAGLLAKSILDAVKKIGLLPNEKQETRKRIGFWPAALLILGIIITAAAGFLYFRKQKTGEGVVITGSVQNAYTFPNVWSDVGEEETTASANNVTRTYKGFPIEEIIRHAQPEVLTGNMQITASDGYQFFITLEEVFSNDALLLVEQGSGGTVSYNVMGAESQKAWVRGAIELRIVPTAILEIKKDGKVVYSFQPQDWQASMDSTFLQLDSGSEKLQGVPLDEIWRRSGNISDGSQILAVSDDDLVGFTSDELSGNTKIRLFVQITESGMEFILGRMNGEVLLESVDYLEIE